MDYKSHMDKFTVSERTKDRFYDTIMQKKEEKMNFTMMNKGKFAVLFVTLSILLAIGAGVWYSRTLTAIAPSGTSSNKDADVSYALAFSGSYNRSRIPFSIEEFDENGEIARTVKSYQELVDFCDENNFPFFDETDENYHSDLAQKVREYDVAFFRKKALVLLFKLSEEYDLARFEGLAVDGGVLTVTIDSPEGKAVSSMNAFVYLIEAPKSVAERVIEIRTENVQKGDRTDYSGQLYNVEELFNAGEINGDDIQSMIYYSGTDVWIGRYKVELVGDGKPKERIPETISDETHILIYMSYLDFLQADMIKQFGGEEQYRKAVEAEEKALKKVLNKTLLEFYLEIVTIEEYCGTYNGYVAVKLTFNLKSLEDNGLRLAFAHLADQSYLYLWKPAD